MELVDIDPQRFAEEHRAALYSLLDHILTHANYAYTNEFEASFNAVISTFDRYATSKIDFDPGPCDGLDYVGRSHNFVTAQCSLLLSFANGVAQGVERQQLDYLAESIQNLRAKLDEAYEQFFGKTPPYLRKPLQASR